MYIKKPDINNDTSVSELMSGYGARDGTRTHTALTTRTSNVLVYHSNTLASAP